MSPAPPVEDRYEEAEDTRRKLLLVSLDGVVVALPAGPLVEVLPARPYARIPGADAAVAGLVNRRGRMLTVVDLGVAFAGTSAAADPEHRVVVVSWRGIELGLAVREVLQLTTEWWTDEDEDPGEYGGDGEGEGEVGGEAGRGSLGHSTDHSGGGADQQLRVIELDQVFAPLFEGGDRQDEEPDTGQS